MERRFLFLTLDEAAPALAGTRLYLVLNDLGQLLVERESWGRDGKRSSLEPIERVLQRPAEDPFRQQVEAGLIKRLDYHRTSDGAATFDLVFESEILVSGLPKADLERHVANLLAGKQIAAIERDYFAARLGREVPTANGVSPAVGPC